MNARRVVSLSMKMMLLVVAGIAVGWLLLVYVAAGPPPWVPSIRWWSLAGTTAVVFWVAVKQFKRNWHQPSFWIKVAGLAIIHSLAYAAVLIKIPEWRLLWFVPPSVIEAGLLVLILGKLVQHTGS